MKILFTDRNITPISIILSLPSNLVDNHGCDA